MYSPARFLLAAALLAATFTLPACTKPDAGAGVPPAGTRVSTTSEVFRQTARGLSGECERIGGCTCILDGIQTTCAVVFACLEAGFCERIAAKP